MRTLYQQYTYVCGCDLKLFTVLSCCFIVVCLLFIVALTAVSIIFHLLFITNIFHAVLTAVQKYQR